MLLLLLPLLKLKLPRRELRRSVTRGSQLGWCCSSISIHKRRLQRPVLPGGRLMVLVLTLQPRTRWGWLLLRNVALLGLLLEEAL